MLCALFKAYLVLGTARGHLNKFDVVAIIHLADLKVEVAEDCRGEYRYLEAVHQLIGIGLQCHTALYSWKVIFESENHLYELIFSACSAIEEESWKAALQEQSALTVPNGIAPREAFPEISTCVFLDLKPAGPIFGQAGTLAQRLSIQRAATVGTRNNACHVIIRNTHRPTTSQESRDGPAELNRSHSLLTTNRINVLAPKRSERVRLEESLTDVYSKDILPFPGMTGSRSSQLIRASAGTIVRKLSLANMHGPFSRRSLSLSSVPTKQSLEAMTERRKLTELGQASQNNDVQPLHPGLISPRDAVPVIGLEVNNESTSSTSASSFVGIARRNTTRHYRQPIPPEFGVPVGSRTEDEIVEERLDGRKRWSNPFGLLKSFSSDGVRHLLYSSKTAV